MFFTGLGFVLLLILCFGTAIKFLPKKYQLATFTLVATLLLTPSWAPATIVAVPIPFGALLCFGLFSGALHELFNLILLFWWWHLIAFPVTGILVYLLAKKFYVKSLSIENT